MTMRAQVLCLALVASLSAACSFLKPHADPTQYFVLTSEERKPAAVPAQKLLGVDRIELPEYLLRSELVTRSESNQLKIAEYDHWGEPLKDGFLRTLRSDLENQLGAGHVLAPPFDPAHRPALTVDVEVRRFERVLPEGVVLEGMWILRDTSGAALITQEVRLRQPVARDDTSTTVAALSTALGALAGEIADAVRARP
jgi:hypothetical protein